MQFWKINSETFINLSLSQSSSSFQSILQAIFGFDLNKSVKIGPVVILFFYYRTYLINFLGLHIRTWTINISFYPASLALCYVFLSSPKYSLYFQTVTLYFIKSMRSWWCGISWFRTMLKLSISYTIMITVVLIIITLQQRHIKNKVKYQVLIFLSLLFYNLNFLFCVGTRNVNSVILLS